MYFIELLVKKFKTRKKYEKERIYPEQVSAEDEPCEHVFMPIDSSGEILACKNCGLIVNKSDMATQNKKFNFFMGK